MTPDKPYGKLKANGKFEWEPEQAMLQDPAMSMLPKEQINVIQPGKIYHSVSLNSEDPFEAAMIELVEMNRKKRRDYARDGDPFSNFEATSQLLGLNEFSAVESAYFNVLQKVARLSSLRANGRMSQTANESVLDSYLDLAVYAVITYALVRQANLKQQDAEDEIG